MTSRKPEPIREADSDSATMPPCALQEKTPALAPEAKKEPPSAPPAKPSVVALSPKPAEPAAASPPTVVVQASAAPPSPRTPAQKPVRFNALERHALRALMKTHGDLVEAGAAATAAALASGDLEARICVLARKAALAEKRMDQFDAMLNEAIVRRDPAAASLRRQLDSATRRFIDLMDALRVQAAPSRRLLVMAKGEVAIAAEESR